MNIQRQAFLERAGKVFPEHANQVEAELLSIEGGGHGAYSLHRRWSTMRAGFSYSIDNEHGHISATVNQGSEKQTYIWNLSRRRKAK